jgi:hypothetical protein
MLTKKVRLCVDYLDLISYKAIDILRDAGFRPTATPVSGLGEPEAVFENITYRGIEEIQQLVKEIKNNADF